MVRYAVALSEAMPARALHTTFTLYLIHIPYLLPITHYQSPILRLD
ncbi:MAG: hypothetical protein WCO29_08775 [Nostocales cyanobacterium ELA583]|jgi:hypothetical protein